MIEILPGVFYNNAVGYWDQLPEVLEAINIARENIESVFHTEPCDSGNQRVTERIMDFPLAFLKITYVYVSSADSPDWAGITKKIVEVYAK